MNEEEALKEFTIKNLLEHCIKQCAIHKDSKLGYEHYIFMQLLKETYARNIEDYIIDYSLICKGEKVMVKQELYKLLYEWFITETCEDCQHISTFRDGDNRHPCNRCECYEKFRIDDRMKEDLKEKVKQIMNVVNGKEETK